MLGQLKDLVGSHELGLSIQQETPQLLMEGDTLDDQDTTNYVQEQSANSTYDYDMLIQMATDAPQEEINDQLPMDDKAISLPTISSSQSTDCVSTPVICMSTSETITISTPVAHVSSSIAVTSSQVNSLLTNMESPSVHVSSPPVTMNSSITNANNLSLPLNPLSYALTLLSVAPYSVITSLPLSLSSNEFVTNQVSSVSSDPHHGNTNVSSHNPSELFFPMHFSLLY